MALELITGNFGPSCPVPPPISVSNTDRFASRASDTPMGSGRRLARGYMKNLSGSKTITFNFMYNPPEVIYGYDISEQQLSPDELENNPAFAGIPYLVNGASISFMLYFDRSVEMAERPMGPIADTSPMRLGVLHDLAVYERLVGDISNGTVVSKPILVKFSRGTHVAGGLNFKGYIVGTQVTFKQFNQDMIPTRMEMSVTMRKSYGAGSATSGALDPTAMADPMPNGAKAATSPTSGPPPGGVAGRQNSGSGSQIGVAPALFPSLR